VLAARFPVNSEEWEEGRNKEAEGLVPGVGSWVSYLKELLE